MSRRRPGTAGFTLLELLVALVVFGFILAGLAGGLDFGLRAQSMQDRTVSGGADLAATDRLLRNLVAEMDPGSAQEPPQISAGRSTLGFVTDLGRAAAALGEDGDAQVGLGVDSSHRLVLRYAPLLHAIRLGPAPAPRSVVLMTGVERVEFAFWAHAEGGAGAWQPSWAEPGLPPLVRIRLRFAEGSRRSWPDIIAATERLPAGE